MTNGISVHSFKCGRCNRQLAKCGNKEQFINSKAQVKCRNCNLINFSDNHIAQGSANYIQGKLVPFTWRRYDRKKVSPAVGSVENPVLR